MPSRLSEREGAVTRGDCVKGWGLVWFGLVWFVLDAALRVRKSRVESSRGGQRFRVVVVVEEVTRGPLSIDYRCNSRDRVVVLDTFFFSVGDWEGKQRTTSRTLISLPSLSCLPLL